MLVNMLNKGTDQYWALVADLMRREGMGQREAEYALTIRWILRYSQQGHRAHPIILRLEAQWGLHSTTLYRRLAKARQTICIP